MQALSQTNAGDTCTIKWMFGVPEILIMEEKKMIFLILFHPFVQVVSITVVFPVKNPVCAFFVPQNVVYCIIR